MPTLSYHFGLSPADVWDMTHAEYQSYLGAVATINKDLA